MRWKNLRKGFRGKSLTAPATMIDWRPVVHEMRLFKSPEEIAVLRRAGEIHRPGTYPGDGKSAVRECSSTIWKAKFTTNLNRHGARYPSYNTIVGSGENGCIFGTTPKTSVNCVTVTWC